jgi:hypothetical protein
MKVPSEPQRHALATLAGALPEDAYLAGGVAVAARFGHRTSHDLDIFTVDSDPELLADALGSHADVRVTSRSGGTVYLEVGGIPVSIIRHRYPLVANPERIESLPRDFERWVREI